MCENLVAEPTRNPWDLTRTFGGSGGGAAAAVAAATDRSPTEPTGPDRFGTLRPGAVFFGLKPSLGRVPLWPTPDIRGGRIQIGPLARRVRAAAAMLKAMAGPDPRDPLSIDEDPGGMVGACAGDIRGLRLAWARTSDTPRWTRRRRMRSARPPPPSSSSQRPSKRSGIPDGATPHRGTRCCSGPTPPTASARSTTANPS